MSEKKNVLVIDTENHKVMETSLTFEEIRIAEQAMHEAQEIVDKAQSEMSDFEKHLQELKANTESAGRVTKVRVAMHKAGFNDDEVDCVDERLAKAFEFVAKECHRTFDEYAKDLRHNPQAQLSLMMSWGMFK